MKVDIPLCDLDKIPMEARGSLRKRTIYICSRCGAYKLGDKTDEERKF